MSLLSRLFGGGGGSRDESAPAGAATEYEGFRITPEPISEGGQFRIAALIERELDGETKSHRLVRADVLRDRDEAVEASLRKAKMLIDEQGTRLFG